MLKQGRLSLREPSATTQRSRPVQSKLRKRVAKAPQKSYTSSGGRRTVEALFIGSCLFPHTAILPLPSSTRFKIVGQRFYALIQFLMQGMRTARLWTKKCSREDRVGSSLCLRQTVVLHRPLQLPGSPPSLPVPLAGWKRTKRTPPMVVLPELQGLHRLGVPVAYNR